MLVNSDYTKLNPIYLYIFEDTQKLSKSCTENKKKCTSLHVGTINE